MTKLEQKLQKVAKEKKEIEKKVASEKRINRDKFLKLLGKSYLERIKRANDNEGKPYDKKWKKDTLSKVAEYLPNNEKIWLQKKIDEDLFNLELKLK